MKTKNPVSFLNAVLLLALSADLPFSAVAAAPRAGEKAPLVEGVDALGKAWKLADLVGKKVVLLYFYPKDETPGCTKEACGWRDSMDLVKTNGAEVVGVSFDSSESHQKFAAKHSLNFTLVADTDGKIADAYGVRWVGGRSMARRVTFVIGLDGVIMHVTDSPLADTHLTECKALIERLKKK